MIPSTDFRTNAYHFSFFWCKIVYNNLNKNIKDGYGVVYYPVFSCSEDPFHPLGVGMYAGDYYPHRSHMYNFGKRVKDIDSLPKKVIEFIKYITR